MDSATEARARMVADQIARRGVTDPRVLAAMRDVPREAFVAPELRPEAFRDAPLPIAHGQTISQPFIVALMAEAARLQPTDRVLEVGAGSGYASAVLARLAAHVTAIERHAPLAQAARDRLSALGFHNVEVVTGDGTLGWPAAAPFDAIVVSAGGPRVPEALKAQLAPGGRLVIPVGPDGGPQDLLRLTRSGDGFEEESLGGVRFVPLIGAEGWKETAP
jgi:protein-L-isoaspartate(D-aspartate) O-methyltransferase